MSSLFLVFLQRQRVAPIFALTSSKTRTLFNCFLCCCGCFITMMVTMSTRGSYAFQPHSSLSYLSKSTRQPSPFSSCITSTQESFRKEVCFSRNSGSVYFMTTSNQDGNENSHKNKTSKATLTKDTTWRLRFSLNGVPTKKGRKVGELLYVDVKFLQEDGYGKSA